MKINELKGGVLYIENAIPLSKEFIKAIEENNENKKINKIIPPWEKWLTGYHVDGVWTPINQKGFTKDIDWDHTINHKNTKWPKINIGPLYSQEHSQAYNILKMIDEPYQKALEIWSEKTGNPRVNLITKNYAIKKYNTLEMLGSHTDRDHDHEFNTFDWTALIYLNDDYEGGELEFNKLGYEIKPSAGSIIFFSSDEVHSAKTVLSGNKYFIFFYIQSQLGYTHSINENFSEIVKNIKLDIKRKQGKND
jgi:hypothetical protein